MPHLPAFCDCGTIFNSGINVNNSATITLVDCVAGPCPKCGGTGNIPNGIYNVLGNIIELLVGPQQSVQDLQRLAELFRKAQEKRTSPEALSKEVKNKIPSLGAFADFIPTVPEKLLNWTIFLAAIATLIGFLQSSSCEIGDLSGEDKDQLINESIERSYEIEKNTPESPMEKERERSEEIKLDEPCTCGSGKIYGQCCMIA